jgi:hypothetical protein
MVVALNCSPCSLSLTHRQPFPGGHGRQRSDDFIPVPRCFHAEDTEAAFVAR